MTAQQGEHVVNLVYPYHIKKVIRDKTSQKSFDYGDKTCNAGSVEGRVEIYQCEMKGRGNAPTHNLSILTNRKLRIASIEMNGMPVVPADDFGTPVIPCGMGWDFEDHGHGYFDISWMGKDDKNRTIIIRPALFTIEVIEPEDDTDGEETEDSEGA
jgi:hypothetical protein